MVPASTDGPPGGSGGEPPGRQRWEFVGAFVEHSWTRPGTDRSAAKPHLLLTMATVSAVLALGAGVVLQLIAPVPLAAAAPAPTPSKASTTTFAAVAGWDCPATAIAGFEATGRQSTWRTIAAGGWPNDGCHGTFEVLPLNGSATSEVNAPSAVWWFRPPAGARCLVAVYIPRETSPSYQPAPAARFSVSAGRGGQSFAQFTVDQSAKQSTWVPAGTYPVDVNGIAVVLVAQGQPSTKDTMLAITQVKVECTG